MVVLNGEAVSNSGKAGISTWWSPVSRQPLAGFANYLREAISGSGKGRDDACNIHAGLVSLDIRNGSCSQGFNHWTQHREFILTG